MDKVQFKGAAITLYGNVPEPGDEAPEFTFVTTDLKEVSSYDLEKELMVLISVPSLDTGVCIKEARQFNEDLAKREGVSAMIISQDLPFAIKRACSVEGIDGIQAVSDYRYQEFGEAFNLMMIDGPLKGLLARAVFVVKNNMVVYTELVPDIGQEPNYQAVYDVLDKIQG